MTKQLIKASSNVKTSKENVNTMVKPILNTNETVNKDIKQAVDNIKQTIEKSDKNTLWINFDSLIIDYDTNYRLENFYGNIRELANSIIENGQKESITVIRNVKDKTKFNVIHGFRRCKAFELLKKDRMLPKLIKINVLNSSDVTEEFIIIDHLTRNDSKPFESFEESNIYNRLINGLKWTPKQLSKKIGKSEQHISNMLKLYKTPQEVKNLVILGKITANTVLDIVKVVEPENLVKEVKQAVEIAEKSGKKTATSKHVKALQDKKEVKLNKIVDKKLDEVININPKIENKNTLITPDNKSIIQGDKLPSKDKFKGDNDIYLTNDKKPVTFINNDDMELKKLYQDYLKSIDNLVNIKALENYKTVIQKQININITPIVQKIMEYKELE